MERTDKILWALMSKGWWTTKVEAVFETRDEAEAVRDWMANPLKYSVQRVELLTAEEVMRD